MFAYCQNNPVNYCDPSGCRPVYLFDEDPAAKVGQEIGEWFAERILRRKQEIDEKRKEDSTLSFVPNPNGGGQLKNSFTITEWSDIYTYSYNLKQQYPENFKGSVEGMAEEWAVHNIACYIPFLDLDRAKDVDFGFTIFADAHPGFNVMMWGVYYLMSPSQYHSDLEAMIVG